MRVHVGQTVLMAGCMWMGYAAEGGCMLGSCLTNLGSPFPSVIPGGEEYWRSVKKGQCSLQWPIPTWPWTYGGVQSTLSRGRTEMSRLEVLLIAFPAEFYLPFTCIIQNNSHRTFSRKVVIIMKRNPHGFTFSLILASFNYLCLYIEAKSTNIW